MIKRILVGTDSTASADLAVQAAGELARTHGAQLLVLHVRKPDDVRDAIDPGKAPDAGAYLQRVRSRYADLGARTRPEAGDPAQKICAVAAEEQSDLIVVGNRGTHGRKRMFLGSVPAGVMKAAPCSVLIVDTRSAQ
jgi:universal stress protein A